MSSILDALTKQDKPKKPFRARPDSTRKKGKRVPVLWVVVFFLAGAGVVVAGVWLTHLGRQSTGRLPQKEHRGGLPPAETPGLPPLTATPTATATRPAPTATSPPAPSVTPTSIPAPTSTVAAPTMPAAPTPGEGLTLNGVLFNRQAPMAIINGKLYGVGEEVQGVRILEIPQEGIRLEGRRTLLEIDS